eukprot:4457894-Alexandrium_andersonii.AAC.3
MMLGSGFRAPPPKQMPAPPAPPRPAAKVTKVAAEDQLGNCCTPSFDSTLACSDQAQVRKLSCTCDGHADASSSLVVSGSVGTCAG